MLYTTPYMVYMEEEVKMDGNNERASSSTTSTTTTTKTKNKLVEPELVLQWGKRIRSVRSSKSPCGIRRKITSRIVSDTSTHCPFNPHSRVMEGSKNGKSPSPEKDERCHSTRGFETWETRDNGRSNNRGGSGFGSGVGVGGESKKLVWPKLYISLSSKEKEEDFLAMKGCKLPQRPKKRAKLVQRTLLLVSPGAWLTNMCQERYEVREKKAPKKRPRGLKAMGNIADTDSE